jgi:hypothetical protein
LIGRGVALKLATCSRSEEMMRAIAIAALLAAFALPSLADAQGGRGGAPAGHRQPTTKDPATPPVTMTKEDRALDRALKGICRGC